MNTDWYLMPLPISQPYAAGHSRGRIFDLLKNNFTGDWILIQKHNFLDKEAFKDKLWVDYKDGFGDGVK